MLKFRFRCNKKRGYVELDILISLQSPSHGLLGFRTDIVDVLSGIGRQSRLDRSRRYVFFVSNIGGDV